MKITKLLPVFLFALVFVLSTACDDKKEGGEEEKDAKNNKTEATDEKATDETDVQTEGATNLTAFADLMCEMQGLNKQLMAAQTEGGQETIEELTTKLGELGAELEALSMQIEESFNGDKELEKATAIELYTILEGCEHYGAEEIEMMKKAIEQN